jgi:hypothetical protein
MEFMHLLYFEIGDPTGIVVAYGAVDELFTADIRVLEVRRSCCCCACGFSDEYIGCRPGIEDCRFARVNRVVITAEEVGP